MTNQNTLTETTVQIVDRVIRQRSQPDSIWSRAWNSKIPHLLAAAGALIQVTWLPGPTTQSTLELSERNMEHIAAASAAVQNLMLAAEARDWSSYWSTGGVLKQPEVFELLGIPIDQKLLGAIFLSPPGRPADRVMPGGLRNMRGEPSDWSRWVKLDK